MIGRSISHYRILEKLGEGGMGVVYKAEDKSLGRTVALKFLPPNALSSEEDRARFIAEARAAASLDHPNICTVFEIHEADDDTFISMAYIEGRTLRDVVADGAMKSDRALQLAIAIAEGIGAAHDKGIVHRDIKSANIMVTTGGDARITDFGLAKLMDRKDEPKERSTMGTVAYMSPEQTRADPVDQRTDVWSLGVVMYEMLAGRRPFRGDYEQSVIYAICNEEPAPLDAVVSGVPAEFVRIVNKAMAKRRKHRYQSMQDMIDDLKALKLSLDSKELLTRSGFRLPPARGRVRAFAVPTVFLGIIVISTLGFYLRSGQRRAEGATIPIAVADFVNETGDRDLDGLSGMLITSLEQSRRLSVLTRSAMFDILRNMGNEDVTRIDEDTGRQICDYANIHVLVVASIRKFDNVYSMDLKVFDMDRQQHLFTAMEQGVGRASIPAMIDKLASETRKGLHEQSMQILARSEAIADMTTPNLEAYQQYFTGEQLLNRLEFEPAHAAFARAIVLDSTFALAQYRLAYVNWWRHENEDIQRAQLQNALALIDRLPEKYRYLLRAQEAVNAGGFEAGIEVLTEIVDAYPEEKEILYNLGDYCFHAEQYEDASRYLEDVLVMDPRFERALDHLAITYRAMGETDRAVAVARSYVEVSRGPGAARLLCNTQLYAGDLPGAIATIEDAVVRLPDDALLQYQLAMIRCLQDQYGAALAVLDSLYDTSEEKYVMRLVQMGRIRANLYMGRYRGALAVSEQIEATALANDDSLAVVMQRQTQGIIHAWGWGDIGAAAARFEDARELKERLAEGVLMKGRRDYWANLAMFYQLSGRYDVAEQIASERFEDDPLQADRIRFFNHYGREDYGAVVTAADTLCRKLEPDQTPIILYHLAECQLENNDFDNALSSLKSLQRNLHYGGSRPAFYPTSFYLAARCHEQKGETAQALASYDRLFQLWAHADEDLLLLADARSRASRLRENAPQ